MRTNLPRVFAAGDITEYAGKVRLIAVGFGEAATAVNNATVAIDPSAKVFPGHSSPKDQLRRQPMKIKVDFDLCESNALCEAMAPEVFELDDDDYLQLKTEETTAREHRERQARRGRLPARRDLAGGMSR